MNNYELVTILSMKVSDEAKVAFAEKIKNLISKNGELTNVDEWGKKVLAYEIKKEAEGFYILFTFSSKPDAIVEIERQLKLDESVLKYMTVRI